MIERFLNPTNTYHFLWRDDDHPYRFLHADWGSFWVELVEVQLDFKLEMHKHIELFGSLVVVISTSAQFIAVAIMTVDPQEWITKLDCKIRLRTCLS